MPGRRGQSPAPGDAVLAAATVAGLLLVVSLVAVVLAAIAGSRGPVVGLGAAALIAAAGSLLLVRTARQGGDLAVVYAADGLAMVLTSGELAIDAGIGAEALLGLLVLPVAHSAAFQPPWRVAAIGAATIVLGGLAAWDAGLPVAIAMLWLLPATAAAALLVLPIQRLRGERQRLVEREAEARRLADEDGLTGVANYRAFWRTLQSEVARSQRHGQPFTLIVLDLDNFKRINDEYGHRVGDRALQAAAEALRRAVRAEDLVCRQGGDEFAVIAVAAPALEGEPLAARLVAGVEAMEATEVPVRLTASAGWATFGEPARTAEALLEHAEAALSRAKRSGGGIAGGPAEPDELRVAEAAAATNGELTDLPPAARPGARLAVVGSLARALAGATSEQAIAETAIAHVSGAVDADWVAILRRQWGPAGDLAVVAVGGGPGVEAWPQAASGGQLEAALRDRRPVLETLPDSAAAGPLRRLVVPLIAGGEVWGALELDSRRPDAFAPAEVRVLQAMTEAVGRALAVTGVLDELARAGWESEGYYELATRRSDPHGREVARVVDRVGRRLGLPEGGLRQLYVAGLFHEIGTVCVPPNVLRKPGQLTDEEFATLRPHPLVGERLLGGLPGLADAAAIVGAERERFDGKGYPYGLTGDEIPLPARILHACDAFVAMTTPRPYRRSVSPDIALGELRRNAASQFDPLVVDALGGFVTERH